MDVNISDLQGRFDELAERARSGEPVVVHNGQSAMQLVPVQAEPRTDETSEKRAERIDRVIREIQQEVRLKFAGKKMPTSDHSDLYDEFGLPK